MKNHKLVAVAIFSLGITSHAQETKTQGSLTQNPVYQKNCAKCRGKIAEGRFMAGPSLRSEKATALSADDLRNIISKGKHHMRKFAGKLSPSDVDALVYQIRALGNQK